MELLVAGTVRAPVALALVCLVVLLARPAAAGSKTFALVVTNNRSTTLSLPDLQYADDDGARYYRLFRSVADGDNLFLLTTFDRATTAVYPDLAGTARPPTRAALEDAVVRLAAAVETARQRGDDTVFYFVYAGHGDIENGRGFVDLEDGRIDGQFIESAIIERVPARTKHIVLDSCNSFFVMNPRKPGGRRWATPKDMALGFAKRHPEVGLFLSTNSDADVFEWSELESGVFSHEVRSGLSGAADVNGDGNVSYSELAGFVDQANSRITREALRPHIYQRGPNGDSTTALFAPSKAAGRRLTLGSESARLWVKSDTGERLLDLHKEAGPMTLVLPGPGDQGVSIYIERQARTEAERPTVDQHDAARGEAEIRLAELVSLRPTSLVRGDRLFASLFATPYGPVAYRGYLAALAVEPEPVYGLRERDISHMHNYLTEMAGADRRLRLVGGSILVGMGGIACATALASYGDSPRWSGLGSSQDAAINGVFGAFSMGLGAWILASKTPGDRVLQTFQKELDSGLDRPSAFARTEQALEDMAKSDRRYRRIMFGVLAGVGLLNATLTTIDLIRPTTIAPESLKPSAVVSLYGTAALMVGVGFALNGTELSTERLLRLYRSDPGLKVQVGVVPVPGGGGLLGLSGKY
jgi:hypothetical protein